MLKLKEYQRKAVDFILDKKKCMLCLKMGTGKTFITIASILELIKKNNNFKILVIAPKNVALNTWENEIEKWAPSLTYINCVKGNLTKKLKQDANIHIINHDKITKLKSELSNFKKNLFDMIVIDESLVFKNTKTSRTKAVTCLVSDVEYVVCLNGTPISNSYLDLYSQIYLLDKGERLGYTKTIFLKKYFIDIGYNFANYVVREDKIIEIKEKVKDICFNINVNDEIKQTDVNIEPILIDFTDEIKAYKSLIKNRMFEFNNDDVLEIKSLIYKLQQYTSGFLYDDKLNAINIHGIKQKALQDLIKKTDCDNKNYLIAYNFKHEINLIKEVLPNAVEFKPELVKDWNKGKIKYFLCNPQTTGVGLNLQYGGSTIIWYSLTYNYSLFVQFNARLHRIGQKDDVDVYCLMCESTIDENIYNSLNNKDFNLVNFLKDIVK